MRKFKALGVKKEPPKTQGLAEETIDLPVAVVRIPNKGMSKVSKVPPDLVIAPRLRIGTKERVAAMEGLHGLEVRARLAPLITLRDGIIDTGGVSDRTTR